ncbi:hypothetical protein OENI_90083 [Oenococcus oeni]|nr:hypothetical protein OENI_90083 [Oenococcus oeni]
MPKTLLIELFLWLTEKYLKIQRRVISLKNRKVSVHNNLLIKFKIIKEERNYGEGKKEKDWDNFIHNFDLVNYFWRGFGIRPC